MARRCPPTPASEGDVPYNLSMVELDEGVRLWSNVVGSDPETIQIGDRVQLQYDDVTPEYTLPRFRRRAVMKPPSDAALRRRRLGGLDVEQCPQIRQPSTVVDGFRPSGRVSSTPGGRFFSETSSCGRQPDTSFDHG